VREHELAAVLEWLGRFQNIDVAAGSSLADISASCENVCRLSHHIVGEIEFGSEPSGYTALIENPGNGGSENDR